MLIYYIFLCIFSYLLGSINFARIAAFFWRKPIKEGENPGATVAFRQISKSAGVFTAFFDILKGAFPIFLFQYYFYAHPTSNIFRFSYLKLPFFTFLVGALAIIGHCWPIYYKFKGGRGGATTIGVALSTLFKILPLWNWIILLLIYLFLVFVLRMNLGLIGLILLPLILFFIFLSQGLINFYQYFLGIALIILILMLRNSDQIRNFWKINHQLKTNH